jgi:hypothetical protein
MTAEKSRPISIARPQHINKDENKKVKNRIKKEKRKGGAAAAAALYGSVSLSFVSKKEKIDAFLDRREGMSDCHLSGS